MHFPKRPVALLGIGCLLLSSCAPVNRNNTYGAGETGHNEVVMYGKIKSFRQVDVVGNNTGTGAVVGAVGGGALGSTMGKGNGSIATIIAGAVIGGIAGAAAEQAMKDQQGIEYIIRFSETGDTRSIVQNIAKTDQPLPVGQCVMVQMSGNYQRILRDDDPADCPAPPKHKKQHVKTKLKENSAETTIEHDE